MNRYRSATIIITICLVAGAVYGIWSFIDADWNHRNRVLKIITTGDDSELDSFVNDCGHVQPVRGM